MGLDRSNSRKKPLLTGWERIYGGYIRILKHITRFFRRRKMDLIGDTIVAFLAEPKSMLLTMHYAYIGKVPIDNFHHYDLNPPLLSYYEKNDVSVLLIHGAGGNQGLWLPLAKALQKANIGPVFTLNVPNIHQVLHYKNQVQEKEKEAVRRRLNGIRQLYLDQGKRPPKFIILGFSRGGDIGLSLCDEDNDIIKVIRLGKVTAEEELDTKCVNRLIEVDAVFDAICHWNSQLPPEARHTVKTGHLGLLYSKDAQEKIIKAINKII